MKQTEQYINKYKGVRYKLSFTSGCREVALYAESPDLFPVRRGFAWMVPAVRPGVRGLWAGHWQVLWASIALVLPEFFGWLQSKSVRSHCSSHTPVSHWDKKLCRKERGFCGPLSVIFDMVEPLSEAVFGRRNRSVANQNWGALTDSCNL